MAIMYRAIFNDDEPGVLDRVKSQFRNWLQEKHPEAQLPSNGTSSNFDGGSVDCIEQHDDDLAVLRIKLKEELTGAYWGTTACAISEGSCSWIWIDNEHASEDVYSRPPRRSPPRFVSPLLREGRCRIGPVELGSGPRIATHESHLSKLLELLLEPTRECPIVVVGFDHQEDEFENRTRAEEIAKKLVGVAPVWLLWRGLMGTFADEVGEHFSVHNGSVRSYLPGLDIGDDSPFRHRFATRSRFQSRRAHGAYVVGDPLLRKATQLRPPRAYYERALKLPEFSRGVGADEGELLDQLVELEQQIRELTEERDDAYLEAEIALSDLDNVQRRNQYLVDRLRDYGSQDYSGAKYEGEILNPSTFADLLDECVVVLQNVHMRESRDPAGQLDYHTKAGVWARKAWRSLKALDSYANAKKSGDYAADFKAFCESPPAEYEETIPSNWVARGESETTAAHPRFRSLRTFLVSADIEPSGEIYMPEHIKLEKGSDPAPRIHFFDDTGHSGDIYVGYIGRHLESKKTN